MVKLQEFVLHPKHSFRAASSRVYIRYIPKNFWTKGCVHLSTILSDEYMYPKHVCGIRYDVVEIQHDLSG